MAGRKGIFDSSGADFRAAAEDWGNRNVFLAANYDGVYDRPGEWNVWPQEDWDDLYDREYSGLAGDGGAAA